jgi:hypothetical protein
MKNHIATLFIFIAALLATAPARAQVANGSPPELMTYQGYLTDVNGAALASDRPRNYDVIFRIYTEVSGGTRLWSERQTVTVDKGYFSIVLGQGVAVSGEANAASLAATFQNSTASDRFIGFAVVGQGSGGSDLVVEPRLRFLTSPYSFLATKARALDASTSSRMNDNPFYLRFGSDTNHTLAFAESFGGALLNGPALIGYSSGVLGTVYSGPKTVLKWDSAGWVSINKTEDAVSTLDVNGTVTATGFSGNGSLLTSLNAANVSGGVFGDARIPGLDASKITSGSFGADRIPSLDASKIGSGTIAFERIPSYVALLNFNQTFAGVPTLSAGAKVTGGYLSLNDKPIYFRGTGNDSNHGVGFGTNLVSGANGAALWGYDGGVLGWRNSFASSGATLYWTSSGRVGIGTSTPVCPLEVKGTVNLTKGPFAYMNGGGDFEYFGGSASFPYTIVAEGRVAATEFNAVSDARIKEIAGRSDPRADLETLRKLRVTDYRHIDKSVEGNAIKKGFIAQEVEQIIPEAVSKSRRFTPDIFVKAAEAKFDPSSRTAAIRLNKEHHLAVGDRVRLFADDADLNLRVSSVANEKEFVVENCDRASAAAVFVYGREVSDFRTLNYDRIFTTGISAIQELARRADAFDEKAARVEALERDVAELKQMVRRLAANSDQGAAPVIVAGSR